jgi:hypothetical protein
MGVRLTIFRSASFIGSRLIHCTRVSKASRMASSDSWNGAGRDRRLSRNAKARPSHFFLISSVWPGRSPDRHRRCPMGRYP